MKIILMAFSVFCKCLGTLKSTKQDLQEWDLSLLYLLDPPFDAADQVANSISSGLIARMGI